MCGRYALTTTTAGLYGEFGVDEPDEQDFAPSWNIAPTDPVPAVVRRPQRGDDDDAPEVRQLRTVRWGLVPSWAKDPRSGARLINARSETVTRKPAFKTAAARRRCLLPASGYYEWQPTAAGKVPYYLHGGDGGILAFAGLYELWRDPARDADDPARWLWTCTVITRPAGDSLGHIHDRCPVIVPRDLYEPWLDCSSGDASVAAGLLEQMPEPRLLPRRVSRAVNSVRNNAPELIEPVADDQPSLLR